MFLGVPWKSTSYACLIRSTLHELNAEAADALLEYCMRHLRCLLRVAYVQQASRGGGDVPCALPLGSQVLACHQ